MPLDPSALVSAGANLAGGVVNSIFGNKTARDNQQHAEHLYKMQRDDGLKFWEMQNSYNSPEQQMQRMQKAGLNPALMYGQGTTGNASSAPDVPQHQMVSKPSPNLGIGNAFDTYFNVATQMQRLSNEKQMGNNLAIDALLKTEDAKSKNMLNSYMATKGYKYRGETERNNTNLTFERYLAQNAQNAFNFGGDLKDPNGIARIDKGSAYSLQAMGMKIMNDLRSTAVQGNRIDNRTKKIRADTEERFRSGNIKDIGAKDWLNMAIQLLR